MSSGNPVPRNNCRIDARGETTLPDLAVILTASTKTAMFRDAAATLEGLGVPVIEIDTGIRSPQ
jgi:hypothetical protein